MNRDFVSSRGLIAFLRKLSVGLPVNLAVAWLLVNGQPTATVAFGVTAAVAGALLVTALDRRPSQESGRSASANTVESVNSRQSLPGFGASFSDRHHA